MTTAAWMGGAGQAFDANWLRSLGLLGGPTSTADALLARYSEIRSQVAAGMPLDPQDVATTAIQLAVSGRPDEAAELHAIAAALSGRIAPSGGFAPATGQGAWRRRGPGRFGIVQRATCMSPSGACTLMGSQGTQSITNGTPVNIMLTATRGGRTYALVQTTSDALVRASGWIDVSELTRAAGADPAAPPHVPPAQPPAAPPPAGTPMGAYTCVVAECQLREMPNGGNVVYTIPTGSPVTVLEQSGVWVRVQAQGGSGWLLSTDVAPVAGTGVGAHWYGFPVTGQFLGRRAQQAERNLEVTALPPPPPYVGPRGPQGRPGGPGRTDRLQLLQAGLAARRAATPIRLEPPPATGQILAERARPSRSRLFEAGLEQQRREAVLPPELANATSTQVFAAIQQALTSGVERETIAFMAELFNDKRLAELSASGVLQRLDAARAGGRLRVPIWVGWTGVHGDLPPAVLSSAPPRALAIAGYIELAEAMWTEAARFHLERALQRDIELIAENGPPNGWFFAVGLEGDPVPMMIFYPRHAQVYYQPIPPAGMPSTAPRTSPSRLGDGFIPRLPNAPVFTAPVVR